MFRQVLIHKLRHFLGKRTAIFAEIAVVNHQADADQTTLRLSMDAKATIKIGWFVDINWASNTQ